MTPAALFGANTVVDQSRTAIQFVDRESRWLIENGYEGQFDTTDAILALLARDEFIWWKSIKSVYTNTERIELPNQHPATIAHALRCLWLAAKGWGK